MMTERPELRVKGNPAYKPAITYEGRYLVLYGGAGSGKSYSAAQKILMRCEVTPGERFLVVRKVHRTLRGSTFNLFREIITKWRREAAVNLSDFTIRFPNGSEIVHAGLDDPEKLKSIQGVTSVWIEEATEITHEDFTQVDLRLRGDTPSYKQIILSFNPVDARHWLKARFFDNDDPEALVLKTTYKDNKRIDPEYKSVLEGITDERYRQVYLMGEWGQAVKGLIYPTYLVTSSIPDGADIVYGLDFGYNNPSALVRVGRYEGALYVEELEFQSKLTNAELIELVKEHVKDRTPVYCDAAEPQRIEELHRAGINAKPADKDVLKGIDTVKAHELNVIRGSQNVLNELNAYKWHEDKTGAVLDKPVKHMDHALDAVRYAAHTAWGKPVRKLKLVI